MSLDIRFSGKEKTEARKPFFKNLKDGKMERNLFITLKQTTNFTFSGKKKEMAKIVDCVQDYLSSAAAYAVVQAEKYEDDSLDIIRWHYHIVTHNNNAKSVRLIKKFGENLQALFPEADVRVERGENLYNSIGYVYKHRKDCEPVVIGNLSQKIIDKCIFMRDRRDKDDPMVKRSRDGKRRLDEEGLLIETICSYMKENNVRVNSITRELIGMDYDVFMYNLEKELNISSIYSLSAIDKVESMIKKDCYYVLPMWIPDMDVIGFSDYYYRLSTGKRFSITSSMTPFYISDQKFPGVYPKTWLESIKLNRFNLDEFISAYTFFYRPKKRREKSLSIDGPTSTGKSSLIEPYCELYKDTCCFVSEEGNFTFGHIAKYRHVIFNDSNVMNLRGGGINQMKNLFEGAPFNIVRKGKTQTEVKAKNIVITSNDSWEYEKGEQIDPHREALKSRLNMFKTVENNILRPKSDAISLITLEAPAICVLCTQTEKYVKLIR